MANKRRGRHQSTCKAGQKTIRTLEGISGVEAVVIGISSGGKSIGGGKPVGHFKLQRQVSGGFKGLLLSSKGVQELFIRVQSGREDDVQQAIRETYPD